MYEKFTRYFDFFQNLILELRGKRYLGAVSADRFIVFLTILSCLIAVTITIQTRVKQYDVWKENREVFYLDDGTPLFTTADAPYFLGVSKYIKKDSNFWNYSENRRYPIIADKFQENLPKPSLRDAPLLSVIIAKFADDGTIKSLLTVANKMIPITAALTAIMIILAFGSTGYWLEGTLAAVGSGLSSAFLTRSGAGRIDTDQLNLGFFYLLIGLLVWSIRAKKIRDALVLASLSGFTYWIFDWWYSKPIFGWLLLGSFVVASIASRRDLKLLTLQTLLFLAISGILVKNIITSGQISYLTNFLEYENLIFPNTYDTITELKKVGYEEILSRIFGSFLIGLVAILGLGIWAIRNLPVSIMFGVAAGFALLNFIIGNRAIFYSAPVLWFGIAYLFLCVIRLATEHFENKIVTYSLVSLAVFLGHFVLWQQVVVPIQKPTFDSKTLTHFRKLKEHIPAENSVIATWWDYGYASIFMNDRPTMHDGGSQNTPTTFIIANNLLSSNQKQASVELNALGRGGFDFALAERYGKVSENSERYTDVYLILTKDMVRWMHSISNIGSFDINTGQHYKFESTNDNYRLQYAQQKCNVTNEANTFLCNGVKFNTITGQLGEKYIVEGLVVSKNGTQSGGKNFKNSNIPFVWQTEIRAEESKNYLIHRDLYISLFHQLYFLNKPNNEFFKLVYDGYPDVRVFKVL